MSRRAAQFDQIAEVTLAMAQSWICVALRRSGMKKSVLAERLGVSRPYVSNLLSGGENLTLQQFARVLWALGFEVRFDIVKRAGGAGLATAVPKGEMR